MLQVTTDFPHGVLLLRYSHSDHLILKVFGEGGSDMLPLLHVLLLLPLLVVLPTTFYNPGPFGKQNYLGRFSPHLPHCHFIVVRASFCKRRPHSMCITLARSSPWISSRKFCTVQNTTRTRIPMWSRAGTSYF